VRDNIKPSIDVAVPCYNYASYLKGCVDSILSQEGVNVRVLIVDDCSPDNTAEVAAQLVATDPRVSYTRNETNLGLVGTANRGVIEWARAPYTVLLSADDALTPGSLARSTSVLEANPDVGMVYGMAMVVGDTDGQHLVSDRAEFEYRKVTGPDFLQRFSEHGNQVASPTAVVRTELQHQLGGYNPTFPHTCDVEMWMRFATRSSIAVINAPQAYYRWHSGNMSKAYIKRPFGDMREQLETVKFIHKQWGQHIEGYPAWIAAMTKRIAAQVCWLGGLAIERGDVEGGRACLDYARSIYPDLWRLKGYWGYQTKALIGGRIIRAVRGGARLPQDPFQQGSLFGWWPDAAS